MSSIISKNSTGCQFLYFYKDLLAFIMNTEIGTYTIHPKGRNFTDSSLKLLDNILPQLDLPDTCSIWCLLI
uniref:Uncharacterized protein n=1 Tax=Megaselia scalaris TaxID=36166 RepID=T1GVV0_MEGSC